MQDELEDELEIEDWADEALWLVCLLCGGPLEACDCKVQTPIPPPKKGLEHPFQCDVIFRIRRIDSD